MDVSSALVLSTDVLAAALLAALVELEGYAPRFAHADEPAREALRRVRPAVVLIDCESAEACSAAVIGPATMIGVRVVLFGRPAVAHVLRACAEEFGVPALALPPAPGALQQALGPTPR